MARIPKRPASPSGRVTPPEAARQRLLTGNQRFVSGRPTHPRDIGDAHRSAAQQQPFAAVLTCVDARVIPEVVFDTAFGELCVIRTAGHVLDQAVAGSVAFAVAELGVHLVVVLGHEDCGAVRLVVDTLAAGMAPPAHLGYLAEQIRPAVSDDADEGTAAGQPAGYGPVMRRHARRVAAALRDRPAIQPAVAAGTVHVVPATYDVADGQVAFLGEYRSA